MFNFAEKKGEKMTVYEMRKKFKIKINKLIHECLNQINHLVAGCDSPYSVSQIQNVQEALREIEEILDIKQDDI